MSRQLDLSRIGPRVVLATAIVAVVGLAALLARVGSDAQWLAALGHVIVHRGAIPAGVPFAAAPTRHWPNALVLAELIFGGLESALGDRGLMLAQLLAVAGALAILARDANAGGAEAIGTGAALLLVGVGGLPSLSIVRVQLFSLLLFPALVALLRSQSRTPSRRIWLAVPLLTLWSNLHGAALLGLGVLFAYLLLERARRQPALAAAVAGASAAAMCLTPALARTVEYYHGVLTNEAAQRGAGMWGALSFTSPLDLVLVLAAIVLLARAWKARTARWEWCVLAVLALLTVRADRNGIWLLFFAAVPAARALAPTRSLRALVPALAVASVLALVFAVVSRADPRRRAVLPGRRRGRAGRWVTRARRRLGRRAGGAGRRAHLGGKPDRRVLPRGPVGIPRLAGGQPLRGGRGGRLGAGGAGSARVTDGGPDGASAGLRGHPRRRRDGALRAPGRGAVMGATAGAVHRPPSTGILTRARVIPLVPTAFVASRLLALAGGIAGVLALHKHATAAAVAAVQHQLGPVGYLLSGSVARFDSGYYLDIAQHGYGPAGSGKLAFFPLYPLATRAVSMLTGSGVLAGALVSSIALLVALVALHRLCELELGRRAADATVLLLAFAPLSFFFSAVYTESLFLALTVGAVLAARSGRWRLACGLGALATLTRPTGLLLVVALGIGRIRCRGGLDRGLAWLGALPVALLGYMALLAAHGYPWLGIFSAEASWHRVSSGPVVGAMSGVWAALRGAAGIFGGASVYRPQLLGPFGSGTESMLLLAVLVLAVAALVVCWRRLPAEYAVYAGVVLLACLSSPDVGQPLWSLDRYTLTIFPLWMAAGAWLSGRRIALPAVVLCGSALLVFYAAQFASWSFVA